MHSRIQPLSFALFAADLIWVVLGLAAATFLRSTLPIGTGGALPGENVSIPWIVYLLGTVCWAVGMTSSGAYNPQLALRWFNESWRVVWGNVLSAFLMAGLLYLTFRELSRLQFVYFFTIAAAGMLFYRAALRFAYRRAGRGRPGSRTRILIVGAGDLGERIGSLLLDHSRWGFNPIGYLDDDPAKQGQQINSLPVMGKIDDLADWVKEKKVDEVWTALPLTATSRLEEILRALERISVRVKVVPDYFSLALVRANVEILDGVPIIGLRDPLIGGTPRLVKRLFDIASTLLLLTLLSPLMLLVALAVKIDSRGPAMIRQERVGENGRLFKMLKFRTMVADADQRLEEVIRRDAEGQMLHKSQYDPRVTRTGRLLRRFSLDELPQFVNVLKGDMSLVGPRPEMPWLVDRYEPWQRKRFAVPQGLTGWWQINGRSDKPMHLNTADDLYYVYNYSIWLDMLILVRTPFAVIRGKGAF